jgi:hypothetical protein
VATNAPAPSSRFLQERFSELAELVDAHYSAKLEEAMTAVAVKSRRAANEEMNQLMRRLRECRSTDEVAAWLVDSTAPFASQAALFEITPIAVRGIRARGFAVSLERFEKLEIALDRAPAFAHSAHERDTVVAIGSPGEVSPEIVAALGHAPDEKVYLYPVVIEAKTVAVLYATAGGAGRQFVDGAALELLTQAVASTVQILSAAIAVRVPRTGGDLVNIEGIEMPAKPRPNPVVLQQAREARARWYARAAVAGIQLKRKELVAAGRAERNVYKALKPEIDAARRTYRQDFLAVSPVIADYLNTELIKLAHNDASLLGPDYPGSLV